MRHLKQIVPFILLTFVISCVNKTEESPIYIQNGDELIPLEDVDDEMIDEMNSGITQMREKWIGEFETDLLTDSVYIPSIDCSLKFMADYEVEESGSGTASISHIDEEGTGILTVEIIRTDKNEMDFTDFKDSLDKSLSESGTEVIADDQEKYDWLYDVLTYDNSQENPILFQFFTASETEHMAINISQPKTFDGILLRENMVLGSAIVKNVHFHNY